MSTDNKGKNRGYYRRSKQQSATSEPEAKPSQEKEKTQEQPKASTTQKPEEGKATTVSAPPRPNKNTGKPPAPRHLATRQTPYKNDPLYLDSIVLEGDRGFIQSPEIKTFSPSFDSFMPLVHHDYFNIVAANRPFGKVVSLSVYAYYNIMHLWARAFAIMRHRKMLSVEETRFLERFEHDMYPTTEPINTYLRGFGDFTDTNGVQHHFKLAGRPNKTGHFGRISKDTHNFYEAYPAPYVALSRIENDVVYTEGGLRHPIWEMIDLRPQNAKTAEQRQQQAATSGDSEELQVSGTEQLLQVSGSSVSLPNIDGFVPTQSDRPAEEVTFVERDMPTVNLLGWYPAEKLSSNQMTPIKQCLAGGGFITSTHMLFVAGLMRHVADNLKELKNYKTSSALHESANGSCAQEAFLDVRENRDFHRANYYSSQISRVTCLSGLDVRLATSMRVMGLRVKKNTIEELNTWACYDFGRYAEVPDNWIANRNQIFAAGMELQSYGTQHTVVADREQYVLHFLRSAIVRTNRD